MIINDEITPYFFKGKVQAYTDVFTFTAQLVQSAGEISGPKMDKAIRENFEPEFANKLVGKDHSERIDDEPYEWEDDKQPRPVSVGYWIWATEIDWENGSLWIEWLSSDATHNNEFFYDEEMLGTEFEKADFEVLLTGMCFDANRIELLLPTNDLLAIKTITADSSVRTRPTGRPQKWDWEGALAFIVSEAQTPDGLPTGPGSQARIEEAIRGWFVDTTGEAPAASQIRHRAAKIVESLETPKRPINL